MPIIRFLLIFFLVTFSAYSFSQCDCDYVVPHNSNPDGAKLNIQPGDVICLHADTVYKAITFTNIVGTATNPVIIKNCSGQAFVESTGSFGVKFTHSKHFKFLGNGDPAEPHGIKISSEIGFYLTMEQFSTDFEIAHVEIAGSHPENLDLSGFAGIGIKTSPYQDCELFTDKTRTAWVMNNITVHDNYIHDVGGEGMYVGHGFYKGRKESSCTDTTYSHSIKHVRIYNNVIENTGYDGMQIKNTDEDVMIYNNIIKNFGIKNEGGHNEGLFLGEGVTGDLYNNWVENGTGHGIQFQGMGDNSIYNNVIINCAGNGFYGAHGPMVIRIPGETYRIYHNTFTNIGGDGFVFYNSDGGDKLVVNNLFLDINGEVLKNGASNVIENGNQAYSDLSTAKIQNSLIPTEDSPIINSAVDLTPYSISLSADYSGNLRLINQSEVGAFEYYPTLSVNSIINPSSLKIFPNPLSSSNSLSFTINSDRAEELQVELRNCLSQEVLYQTKIGVNVGYNTDSLNLATIGLKPGFYFLVLEGKSQRFIEKFVLK